MDTLDSDANSISLVGFSINSILYQRGIYESEKFVKVKKYGLPMQVADDPELKQFLHSVLKQFSRTSSSSPLSSSSTSSSHSRWYGVQNGCSKASSTSWCW